MFKGFCRMARALCNGCVKNLVMFVYKGLGVGWPRNVERSQEARRNLAINSSTHGTHSQIFRAYCSILDVRVQARYIYGVRKSCI